ncbi:MAG: DUF126 domain-containing protein [Acidimicrobiia bacterium]|nr:DUF126 domain-containing protein [Acidimicrobiia bacterium]
MSDQRLLVDGEAAGELVVLEEPLSFWGGLDAESGEIIDVRHPQLGTNIAGKIVAMAHGRGSSSSASVLAEAIRAGNGPSGIVLGEPDEIVVLGSLVAALLYETSCPVVVVDADVYGTLVSGDIAIISASGVVVQT